MRLSKGGKVLNQVISYTVCRYDYSNNAFAVTTYEPLRVLLPIDEYEDENPRSLFVNLYALFKLGRRALSGAFLTYGQMSISSLLEISKVLTSADHSNPQETAKIHCKTLCNVVVCLLCFLIEDEVIREYSFPSKQNRIDSYKHTNTINSTKVQNRVLRYRRRMEGREEKGSPWY